MKVLFLCVANSARSQMAEGLARAILPPSVEVASAGSYRSRVHPYAVQALAEIGIDIRHHQSKNVDELPPSFHETVDYVITLCAEEVCPAYLYKATHLHWPLPDPSSLGVTADSQLEGFRRVRDAITAKLREFASSVQQS